MRKALALLLVVSLPAIVVGCATTPTAQVTADQGVLDSFTVGRPAPGYVYYVAGTISHPEALLGLPEGYTLVSQNWKKQMMTPQLMKRLVSQMNETYGAAGGGPAASYVTGSGGEQVGVWYSPFPATAAEMKSDTEVAIEAPTPQ